MLRRFRSPRRIFVAARVSAALAGLAALGLAACSELDPTYPETIDEKAPNLPSTSVFGEGGLNIMGLFGGGNDTRGGGGGGAIGVNSFLWRASLDTISFMPLASADPFGGVIITDWYSPPQAPRERFKMNIYILGRELRADGLRVAVFRQNQTDQGRWVDAAVTHETPISLENQILTRARQLRLATAQ